MAFTDLGSLGATGATTNNQTQLDLATSAAIAIGDFIVVVVAADNIANGGDDNACSGVTLGVGGQALTKRIQIANALAAQAGASVSIWYGQATAALGSGGTIRATFGSATLVDASAMTARKFSVAAGMAVDVAGTPGTLVGNTAADPGSLNVTTGLDTIVASILGASSITGTSAGSFFAVGQAFTNVAQALIISSIDVWMCKSGTPTGSLYLEVTATNPNGAVVATSDPVPCSTITATSAAASTAIRFTFPTPPTISASATFGVRIWRTDVDTVNRPQVAVGAGSGNGANNWVYNGTTWSDTGTGDDYKIVINNVECLRVRGIASQVGNNTNLTPTASWTAWANGNSATTGTTGEICARAESRINTATSAASDPTYVSAIYASAYVAFREALPPPTNADGSASGTSTAAAVSAAIIAAIGSAAGTGTASAIAGITSSYVGPGDVVSGIVAAWGTHAFDNAAVGVASQDVIRASDSATQSFAPSITDGSSDVAGMTSFLAATTGKVSKLYDQVGALDAVQATAGNRPAVTLSGPNSVLTTTFTRASSHFLNCGNSSAFNPTAGMSFSMWVSTTGPGGSNEYWALGRDDNALGRSYTFGRTGDTWQLSINGGIAASFSKALAANTLMHFAGTGDAATGWKMYIDGAQVATGSWLSPNVSTANTNIGRRSYSGFEGYWDGTIDDVFIDDRAWTAAEVLSLYNKGNAFFNPTSIASGVGSASGSGTASAIAVVPPPEIYPAFSPQASGAQVTFNFGVGSIAYAGIPPVGFLNWDGTTPVSNAGVGSAAGIGSASAVGRAMTTAVGSASGTSSASAVGISVKPAIGAASGTSTASAIGSAIKSGQGAASGTGAATAAGTAVKPATGAASGTGTANAAGVSTAAAQGSAAGTGSASGSSSAATTANGAGSAAGSGTASAQGNALLIATGSASGTGVAGAAGRSTAVSVGSASSTSAASGVGRALVSGIGSASGLGTATAIAAGLGASVGSAAGIGSASATGRATTTAAGAASGTGSASAIGVGLFNGVGSASGIGSATAPGRLSVAAAGSASGTSSAAAIGRSTAASVGGAAGRGSATAFADSGVAMGAAAGVGAANGIGRALFNAVWRGVCYGRGQRG